VNDEVQVFRREIARKTIHLVGLAVPVIYFFTPRTLAVQILAVLSTISIALDFVRHRHRATGHVFNGIFGGILRSHEQDPLSKQMNSVSWFFIAATLSAAVFPKYITIVSVTMALFGDALSAIVGMQFGRRRTFRGKSFEGSSAFFLVALAVVMLFPKIANDPREYLIGVVAAAVGTLVELLSTDAVDDNFTVPLSIALTMWALYKWMLPALDMQFRA
jgi:dolichol kinase